MRELFTSLLVLFVLSESQAQFDTTQCGQSKGCLFMPASCQPPQQCAGAFSYQVDTSTKKLFAQVDGTNLVIEIQRQNTSPNGYLAVGFSKDSQMGDDSVVSCSQAGGPQLSYNSGKSNRILASAGIITPGTTTLNNGVLYCRFQRQIKPGTSNSQIFPLDNSYNILMAFADMNGNELAFHGDNRIAHPRTNLELYRTAGSPPPTNSGQGSDGGGRSTNDKLLIAHGILMVLAWTVFLSTGILFARYYRGAFNERKVCGLLLWFHFHRTLNLIGIGATIAGFVCIFVREGWTWVGPRAFQAAELNRQWGSIHAILGLLACVVAWAQPLNAVFRCGHDSKFRFVFNMIHRFFGAGALLMAFSATMIAVVHFNQAFSNRDAALGLYIAFIAVFGLTLILLELLFLRSCCANRKRIANSDMELTYMGGASYSSSPDSSGDRLGNLKYALLIFHLVVAIGLAVAICVLIGKNQVE